MKHRGKHVTVAQLASLVALVDRRAPFRSDDLLVLAHALAGEPEKFTYADAAIALVKRGINRIEEFFAREKEPVAVFGHSEIGRRLAGMFLSYPALIEQFDLWQEELERLREQEKRSKAATAARALRKKERAARRARRRRTEAPSPPAPPFVAPAPILDLSIPRHLGGVLAEASGDQAWSLQLVLRTFEPEFGGSPAGFLADSLALQGALCETAPDGVHVTTVLPEPLAAHLRLPEESLLVADVSSPLFQRLVTETRAARPAALMRLLAEPPNVGRARSLVDRFAVRNGCVDVLSVDPATALYAAVWVAYRVDAETPATGLICIVSDADGNAPDEHILERLDHVVPCMNVGADADRFGAWLDRRVEHALRDIVAAATADTARRCVAEHERLWRWYARAMAEARPAGRRRIDPAIGAKLARLMAERDQRAAVLQRRAEVRVSASVVAVAWIEIPAALARTRLRRRKGTREVLLKVPAGASRLDEIACESCGRPTIHPAGCDVRLHLLCDRCAPSADGRLVCPVCEARPTCRPLPGRPVLSPIASESDHLG